MVPGLPAFVGTGGSPGLESVEEDALQVSGTHHHSDAILPQGDVCRDRGPPSYLELRLFLHFDPTCKGI